MPRLFVCNLGENYRPSDVTELFDDYGTIKNLNLKGKYGFVDLEYDSDCKEAMRDLNGRSFNGGRLIVQWAKKEHNNNESSHDNKDDRRSESSRSYRYNDSPPLASSDRYKNQPQRKRCSDGRFRISNWRVIVSGLNDETTWQQLKDYMIPAGKVIYATVERPRQGEGLVEFKDEVGMIRALEDLDGGLLHGNRIRIERERIFRSRSSSSQYRSRSRSSSRGRRQRSFSREPRGKTTRYRLRSYSRPKRSTTRSFSRDRSFSPKRYVSKPKTKAQSRSRSFSRSPTPKPQKTTRAKTENSRSRSNSGSREKTCQKLSLSRSRSRSDGVVLKKRIKSRSRSRTSVSSWTWSRY